MTTGAGLDTLRERIQALVKPTPPGQSPGRVIKAIAQAGHGHTMVTADKIAQARFLDTTPPSVRKRARR